MPSCFAKLAAREPRRLLNCVRRNFILSGVAKLDHRLLTPANLIHLGSKLEQLDVVAERGEVAVFVLRHHSYVMANQDGSVYSTRSSAANAVY